MNGVGGGNFAPCSYVTRAQLAQILMNYPDRADTSAKVPTPAAEYRTGALSIAKQGLFSSGGTVTEPVPGTYNPALSFMDPTLAGTTAHIGHANVFYQIPETQSGSPIVYLHGYGQSRMGWQTTPDGREGWSDIFLRYGHAAFLVDQPRRGEAGAFAEQYNADGGDATVIDLPQIGLYGNSHFMFQELNNKEIADHIQGWLEARGL